MRWTSKGAATCRTSRRRSEIIAPNQQSRLSQPSALVFRSMSPKQSPGAPSSFFFWRCSCHAGTHLCCTGNPDPASTGICDISDLRLQLEPCIFETFLSWLRHFRVPKNPDLEARAGFHPRNTEQSTWPIFLFYISEWLLHSFRPTGAWWTSLGQQGNPRGISFRFTGPLVAPDRVWDNPVNDLDLVVGGCWYCVLFRVSNLFKKQTFRCQPTVSHYVSDSGSETHLVGHLVISVCRVWLSPEKYGRM